MNRGFDAGEVGRTPEHSHEVNVVDNGHTHVTNVKDPGHSHALPLYNDKNYAAGGGYKNAEPYTSELRSNASLTGITVTNGPSKSAIDISVNKNDGESYPLVYVLICQKETIPGPTCPMFLYNFNETGANCLDPGSPANGYIC